MMMPDNQQPFEDEYEATIKGLMEELGGTYLGWVHRPIAGKKCIAFKVKKTQFFVRVDGLGRITVFNDSFSGGSSDGFTLAEANQMAVVLKSYIKNFS
jgi:hypothetical protein